MRTFLTLLAIGAASVLSYMAAELWDFSIEKIGLFICFLVITVLANTVQDLKAEVEDLQSRVSELEPDFDPLEGWPPQ